MIEIEAPDGTVVEFPAGTPDNTIKAVMAKNFPTAEASNQSKVSGAADSFTQGITFGFGDELTAFEAGVLGRTPEGGWFDYSKTFGERYDDALKAERGQQDQFREENPATAIAAELAGGLATGAGLASKGITIAGRAAAKPLLTRVAAGAGEGAAYGAAYGAGNAKEGERLQGAGTGVVLGAGIGGALPAVGSALRKPFEAATRKTALSSAPTKEALRSTAKTLYQQADDSGVRFSDQSVATLARGVSDDMATGGYNARLNPKISAVLDELGGLQGQAPTLERLEQVRRVALNAAKSNEPSDRMLAGRIIENIDQFVERISPAHMVAGTNKTQAVQALQQARSTWKTLRKTEMLEEAVEKAKLQASGFENGLRTQFRALLRKPKTRKMFTKEEQAAMIRVVSGGATENTLRFLGKFGLPVEGGNNALGSVLGAGIGATLGSAVGAPGAGAMVAPILGASARKLSERATRQNADIAQALVRGGKIKPAQVPQVIQALENGTLDAPAVMGVMATTN